MYQSKLRIFKFSVLTITIALSSLQSAALPTALNPVPLLKKRKITTAATLAALTSYKSYTAWKKYQDMLHWHWNADGMRNNDSIEEIANFRLNSDAFPQNFLWGADSSSLQIEGNCTNSTYEHYRDECDDNGNKRYPEYHGIACDSRNQYEKDIQCLKNLGTNTYRFSIEWSRVAPEPKAFDQKEIDYYVDLCTKLMRAGIKPIVGLHHYSDPIWFMEQGGFAKKENLAYYVDYATTLFAAIQQAYENIKREHSLKMQEHIKPWFSTFNSPSGYALPGYLTGMRPPYKKDIQTAVSVLVNMLEAHVQTYQAIKATALGKESIIGTTKNIYQLDPENWANPICHIKCYFANILQHEIMFDFFSKGTLPLFVKGIIGKRYTNKLAPQSLDFVGLNYYCHGYIPANGEIHRERNEAKEIPTANPRYTIYAEGLLRAIKTLSDKLTKPLGIPMIITENGFGQNPHDPDADRKRMLFLNRYLHVTQKAIEAGYDIRGYCHWSLMDNWEWGIFSDKCYGLYHVDRSIDPETGQPRLTRTLKKSGAHYRNLITSID